MPEKEDVKLMYCAGCEKDRNHTVTKDHNNEIVLECKECGRGIKFPEGTKIDAAIKKHNSANEPPSE